MLRRNLPLGDQPDRWLLISQVEHARLSYDLAGSWGNEHFPGPLGIAPDSPAPYYREWLAGVLHHDDGWGSWEADPPLDPQEGRPYSFLDMPGDSALAIWRDSIHFARHYGPFAGWCVANHFLELLRGGSDAERPAAQAWQQEIMSLADPWLDEWLGQGPAHTRQLAQQGLAGLQFFDWLSLWFCLECPGASEEQGGNSRSFETAWNPQGAIEFRPAPTQQRGAPREVTVSPWPFSTGELQVEVLGYAIPITHYTTEAQLIERRIPLSLSWQLTPGA